METDKIVVKDIPFDVEPGAVASIMRAEGGSELYGEIERLIAGASRIARPAGMYRVAYIEDRGGGWIVAGGRKFTSRVLGVNLENTHRLFPFVATCGRELEEWAAGMDDMLSRSLANAISGLALQCSMEAVAADIRERFNCEKISKMSPGSLEDWPLEQQEQLFGLLGDTVADTGVELLDDFFMKPSMSVSGVFFTSETHFESCMLCPRENCPGRKAKYDPGLYERKYSTGE